SGRAHRGSGGADPLRSRASLGSACRGNTAVHRLDHRRRSRRLSRPLVGAERRGDLRRRRREGRGDRPASRGEVCFLEAASAAPSRLAAVSQADAPRRNGGKEHLGGSGRVRERAADLLQRRGLRGGAFLVQGSAGARTAGGAGAERRGGRREGNLVSLGLPLDYYRTFAARVEKVS